MQIVYIIFAPLFLWKGVYMLNVWIGNLGKYNEGELVGEWLKLPVSKKE